MRRAKTEQPARSASPLGQIETPAPALEPFTEKHGCVEVIHVIPLCVVTPRTWHRTASTALAARAASLIVPHLG
ncbi:MAG: hypothetical protein HZY76_00155 [Anaerolineae bacterium]|nr:MAG: hypothetical protein HZY76_00155 [Anaerolineae bacterium]